MHRSYPTPPRAERIHPWTGSRRVPRTPACAGNTAPSRTRIGNSPDHPRMRGSTATSGRTRTTSRDHPACARSTPPSPGRPSTGWDHPRMHGEHQGFLRSRVNGAGPPPRARGTRRVHEDQRGDPRTTPRARGALLRVPPSSCSGIPPPRARGALPRGPQTGQGGRRPLRVRRALRRGGHAGGRRRTTTPRARGEHRTELEQLIDEKGAPPRARGARRNLYAPQLPHRTTSACAELPRGVGAVGGPPPRC
jgi:hypothetical protein